MQRTVSDSPGSRQAAMISWLKRVVPPPMRSGLRQWLAQTPDLGVWGALVYALHRTRGGSPGQTDRVRPRQAMFPLHLRQGTSDAEVFSQVFLQSQYRPLCDLPDVRLVLDCGANVGYSSAFFLTLFPSSQVIAVEPDPDNFAMLERNLARYGDRARLVRAGVWSHSVPLAIVRGQYRDGREWATQVRPCGAGEAADLEGIGVASLLASSGFDRISLLKMDIEGAEAIVFGDGVTWLDKVDAIAIELHDDSRFGKASDVFHAAIRGRGFESSRSGELTICRRPVAAAAMDRR